VPLYYAPALESDSARVPRGATRDVSVEETA